MFETELTFDPRGNVAVAGSAWDDYAFCSPNAYDATFDGGVNDIHVTVLSSNLVAAMYATYLGGTGADRDVSAAYADNGDLYVAAYTSSADFPIIGSPWQPAYGGGSRDCVVARLATPCCGAHTSGFTGNANCDVEGKRNLADISRLIDRVYLSKKCSAAKKTAMSTVISRRKSTSPTSAG